MPVGRKGCSGLNILHQEPLLLYRNGYHEPSSRFSVLSGHGHSHTAGGRTERTCESSNLVAQTLGKIFGDYCLSYWTGHDTGSPADTCCTRIKTKQAQ